MRFGFEQRWTAAAGDVLEVYLDEGFWSGLDHLTKTSPPEVLGLERSGDTAVVRLRYKLCVELPSEASRFIDPDDVAWVEETTWDLRALSAQVRFLPVQASALMRASASAGLVQEGREVAREVRGDVRVRIPLLGGKVERAVVDGVGEHLEEEADAVAARLGT